MFECIANVHSGRTNVLLGHLQPVVRPVLQSGFAWLPSGPNQPHKLHASSGTPPVADGQSTVPNVPRKFSSMEASLLKGLRELRSEGLLCDASLKVCPAVVGICAYLNPG